MSDSGRLNSRRLPKGERADRQRMKIAAVKNSNMMTTVSANRTANASMGAGLCHGLLSISDFG
jgi:hypothetical protein